MDLRYPSSPVEASPLLKMMFQNAKSTSILIMDPEGNILDVNYGFQKYFGYSREYLIGQNFSLLFIEEDKLVQLPEKELKETIEAGSSNDENYILKSDGFPTWVHGESIFTRDENGRTFIIKIIHNIQATKLLEEELRKSNEEQEKIINDRDTFVYIASHDLQSPISNIEGLVNGLKDSYPHPEEFEEAIEMIDLSVKRFRRKIAELYAMGQRRDETMAEKETEFRETLNDVLLDLEEETKSSQAEIISDFSNAPLISFSRKKMKIILHNLISNSMKFKSPYRNPKIVIRTEKSKDGYLVLTVRDNGLGIKPEDKDKIFHMYFRGNVNVEGTGVGMAIVKRIVDNAGGKIEVESTLGEGSTFKVCLPAMS